MGAIIGMVITMSDSVSINMPKTRYRSVTIASIEYFEIDNFSIKLDKSSVKPIETKTKFRKFAAMMINIIIPVVLMVPLIDFFMTSKFNKPLKYVITNVAKTPNAALSVGVAKPAYMEPMISTNKISMGIRSFNAINLSFQVTGSSFFLLSFFMTEYIKI